MYMATATRGSGHIVEKPLGAENQADLADLATAPKQTALVHTCPLTHPPNRPPPLKRHRAMRHILCKPGLDAAVASTLAVLLCNDDVPQAAIEPLLLEALLTPVNVRPPPGLFGQATRGADAAAGHDMTDLASEATSTTLRAPAADAHQTGGGLMRKDLEAICLRDPACGGPLQCLLNFKGFQALQTHRCAHALWSTGRQEVALWLQGRASAVFGLDIHPAARLGAGLMLDHGTGALRGPHPTHPPLPPHSSPHVHHLRCYHQGWLSARPRS